MERATYEQIRSIYARVLGVPGHERKQMLDRLCADEPTIRREVDSLLDVADRTMNREHPFAEERIERARMELDAIFDDGDSAPTSTSAGSLAEQSAASPALAPGTRVARFTIERVIGVGGMGTVYAATQEQPSRSVALKLVRVGHASSSTLRRFEFEAEVLGRLRHPSIAQVYDAGIADTPLGRQPYFAMELVEGLALNVYARRKELSTRKRLDLIAHIADAIEHAHRKGVIHRDLKPGNILITREGEPKVLDFGVARATDADLQTVTLQTDIGALVGTVPYMSPEQASGDPEALDTRSDVYALGVLTYELLTGSLPYDLRGEMIHEAVRVIREDNPASISTLDRTLRGDVETIVGKALEKEPSRRYQSAAGLSEDIRRYLADEPIFARPPSAVYQLRKFSHRNKALVVGVLGVFVALLGGVIVASVFAVRADRARGQAIEALEQRDAALGVSERARADALAALDERNIALQLEEEKAQEAIDTVNFVISLIAYVRADELGTVFLEEQRSGLERALADSGATDEDAEESLRLFDDSVAMIDHVEPARVAIKKLLIDRAIEAARTDLADYPRLQSWVLHPLAYNTKKLGYFDEALEMQREVVSIRREILGELDPSTLQAKAVLMGTLTEAGHLEEAHEIVETIDTEVSSLDAIVGVNVAFDLVQQLGLYFYEQRRHEEAERYLRLTVEYGEHTAGLESEGAMGAKSNLANVLRKLGRLEESHALYTELLRHQEKTAGPDSQLALISRANLSMLLLEMGRASDAETMIRDVIDRGSRVFGGTSWIAGNLKAKLASVLEAQGRFAEAATELDGAYRMHVRGLPQGHHRTDEVAAQAAGLFDAWHVADPGAGHDASAEAWRAKHPGDG